MIKRNFPFTILASLSLSITCVNQSFGSGFQTSEVGIASLGRAFAGSGVAADDLSDIFYNPAGMTLLEPGNTAQFSLAYAAIEAEFTNQGSTQTIPPIGTVPSQGINSDPAEDAIAPSAFFKFDINDKFRAGLAFTVPYNITTKYDADWVGRYHAVNSEIRVIDINPSIAYRLNDTFSFGAGVSIQNAEVDESRAIFTGTANDGLLEIDGDSWETSFNLGMLINFDDETHIGLSYRAGTDISFDGDSTISGTGISDGTTGAETRIELPDSFYISFAKDFKNWTFLATARRVQWSQFEQLETELDNGLSEETVVGWKNVWMSSIGINYRVNNHLTLRSGIAIDNSPVPNAEFRSVRIPDSDREWFTIGMSYQLNDKFDVSISYAYVALDDAPTSRTVNLVATQPAVFTDNIVGSYDSNAQILGMQIKYAF